MAAGSGQRRRRRKTLHLQSGSADKATRDLSEVGVTGLKQYSGKVNEEFLTALRGTKAVKVYSEMRDNDPVIGAVLLAITMLLRNIEWTVEPASDAGEDTEPAEFLETCIDDMSHTWEDFVAEVLSMLVFGWSWHEVIYKLRLGPEQKDPTRRSRFDDGRIGWRKLPIRAQETLLRWVFDDGGGIRGLVQQRPQGGGMIEIPIERSLLFRTTAHKNNPEGRSILRNSYRPWWFKKRIEEIEGIGIERDLAGLPVAWVPPAIMGPDANASDKAIFNDIKTLVRDIRRDEQEGVVFPTIFDENGNRLYDLTLLSTGGRRQFDTTSIITRYDKRIAMTALADFILLGHDKVGSFALSSDKTNLFASSLGAMLDMIAAVMNRIAIPRLFALNTFAAKEPPQLRHGDIEKEDLTDMADNLSKLVLAGVVRPGPGLEDEIRQRMELPAAEDEDEFFTGPPENDDDPNNDDNDDNDEDDEDGS